MTKKKNNLKQKINQQRQRVLRNEERNYSSYKLKESERDSKLQKIVLEYHEKIDFQINDAKKHKKLDT